MSCATENLPVPEAVPTDQAIIDQALQLIYSQCHRLAGRLAPDALRPFSMEDLRKSPIGQDLARLVEVARGLRQEPAGEVLTAIQSILETLFWPTATEDYIVPKSFWETELGALLARAKRRALETEGLIEAGEAAARLGVSRSTILRWVEDGSLAGVQDKESGWTLISRRAIERMELVASELR
jgi:excisionase family DNA binding protein